MLLHYLKVAVRNLLKYKTQSVISIVGLAIGLAAFVYGWHWMKYETSYDSFYPDAERSYLVYSPSENNYLGVSSPVLSEYIREHCPLGKQTLFMAFGGFGLHLHSAFHLVYPPLYGGLCLPHFAFHLDIPVGRCRCSRHLGWRTFLAGT